MTTRRRLFIADIARLLGVGEASAQTYHNTAQAARNRAAELAALAAAGQPAPENPGRLPQERDLPVPDGFAYPPDRRPSGPRGGKGTRAATPGKPRPSGAKSPYWYPETIAPCLALRTGTANRPGRPARRQPAA